RRRRARGGALPGRLDRVPDPAVALALRLAGLRVAGVAIERMALVRDLELPVAPLRRPEEGLLHAHAGLRLPFRQEWRPRRVAARVADALALRVGRVEVEREALLVREHLAEAAGLVEIHDGARARGRAGRGTDHDERESEQHCDGGLPGHAFPPWVDASRCR